MSKEGEGVIGNNGHDSEAAKKELTPEELKKERLERYIKAPETFIDIESVICMIIKNPSSDLGISAFVGNISRAQLGIAQIELTHLMTKIRAQMDIASQEKREQHIAQPGAMHRFANKIMRRN